MGIVGVLVPCKHAVRFSLYPLPLVSSVLRDRLLWPLPRHWDARCVTWSRRLIWNPELVQLVDIVSCVTHFLLELLLNDFDIHRRLLLSLLRGPRLCESREITIWRGVKTKITGVLLVVGCHLGLFVLWGCSSIGSPRRYPRVERGLL